ncbi:MAG: hypothetical protein RR053_06505 [Evtepia sp.]
METNIKSFICENCGGTMKWNIAKQCFECSACRAAGKIETTVAAVNEHNFDDYHMREGSVVSFPDEVSVVCSACGSHIAFDKPLTATVCPMCGSTQIAEEKQAAGVPPDGIIPFQVDKDQAQENFRKWVKSRWFAPNRLKKAYQQGKLEGMYLPFWTFDMEAGAQYYGRGGDEYTTRDDEGNETTHVNWHSTQGYVSDFYDDLAVCASEDRVVEVIDKILPYHTSTGSVPYSSAYLSGFQAQRYSIPADVAVASAKQTVESDLREKARQDILNRYDLADVNRVDVDYKRIKYKHVLLPAWLSAFAYNSKKYLYMINGETGEVGGQRPYSVPKIVAAIAVAAVIVIGAVMYFTGSDEEASVLPNYATIQMVDVAQNEGINEKTCLQGSDIRL